MRPIIAPVPVQVIGQRVMGLGRYRAFRVIGLAMVIGCALGVIGTAGGLVISQIFPKISDNYWTGSDRTGFDQVTGPSTIRKDTGGGSWRRGDGNHGRD